MAVRRPKERAVDLASVGGPLAELVEQAAAAGERIVVEKNGVRLAVIIPNREAEEMVREAALNAGRAAVERMRAAFAGVPEDEIERETARAVAEARAEVRSATEADAG